MSAHSPHSLSYRHALQCSQCNPVSLIRAGANTCQMPNSPSVLRCLSSAAPPATQLLPRADVKAVCIREGCENLWRSKGSSAGTVGELLPAPSLLPPCPLTAHPCPGINSSLVQSSPQCSETRFFRVVRFVPAWLPKSMLYYGYTLSVELYSP